MADQIRRFIELSKQLPDIDAILAAMRAQQQFEQQQATRGHQDDLTGLLLVVIKEIIDTSLFTFVWLGRVLVGRAIPDTSSLNEEDTVLVRKIPASSEYVHIIRGVTRLWYGLSSEKDDDGNHEAEVWVYDGITHTLVFRSSSGWSATNIGYVFLNTIFYVPANGYLYFVTHTQDFTVNWLETNRLYKVNIQTLAVTQISVIFDDHTDPSDSTDSRMPAISSVAYFNGKVYLGQNGHYLEWVFEGPKFNPRVYRFDQDAETLTTVHIPSSISPSWTDTKTSLAVYGNDAELLFAFYDNTEATGDIDYTTDGDSWSLLTNVDEDAEIIDMMTDRATGNVYIEISGRAPGGVLQFQGGVYLYDGTLPIQTSLLFPYPGEGWVASESLGARYVGNARQELWHLNPVDREDPPNPSDADLQLFTTGWGEASEDINVLLDYANFNLPGPSQTTTSFGGELVVMVLSSSGPGLSDMHIIIRHEGSPWTLIRAMGFDHEWDGIYGQHAAIIRAPSQVLPHEQ